MFTSTSYKLVKRVHQQLLVEMQQQYIAQAATSLRFVPAWRWWYIGLVVVGNVADNSVRHLKHNSWLTTPHPSVICVELLGHSLQPMTGRLATRPNNTKVKRCYCFTSSVCLSVNKWKFYAFKTRGLRLMLCFQDNATNRTRRIKPDPFGTSLSMCAWQWREVTIKWLRWTVQWGLIAAAQLNSPDCRRRPSDSARRSSVFTLHLQRRMNSIGAALVDAFQRRRVMTNKN